MKIRHEGCVSTGGTGIAGDGRVIGGGDSGREEDKGRGSGGREDREREWRSREGTGRWWRWWVRTTRINRIWLLLSGGW